MGAAKIVVLPVAKSGGFRGSAQQLAEPSHVHLTDGTCIKNRHNEQCVGGQR